MRVMDRRGFVAMTGLSLAGPGLQLVGRGVAPTPGTGVAFPWPYERLDPAETAEQAYAFLPKGGCMYAAFAGIISQLAARLGGPYRSFPIDMMQYGKGGLAGQGSLCGAVNGAAAALSLVAGVGDAGLKMIGELSQWYEQTELPLFVPRSPADAAVPQRSTARSLLCKDSVAAWSAASGLPGSRRGERCRRLTADVARKAVELLNARPV